MSFNLRFTKEAAGQLKKIESTDVKKAKKVKKCLGLLENDPKYEGLNSHKYFSLKGPSGEEIWESYVEGKTPAAFRVFWHYGPGRGVISIVTITRHP